MALRFGKFCTRAAGVAVEALAALTGLLVLCLALLIWRIYSGPLDVTFARDYVQEFLQDAETGYSATLGSASIAWPDLRGPVILNIGNVNLVRYGRTVLNVGEVQLSLSRSQLLLGQIAPAGIILDNPSLRLLRTEDNRIVLSFRDTVPDVTDSGDESDEDQLMHIVRALAAPEGAGKGPSVLNRLRTLEIRNARMMMEDYALGMTWYMPDIDLLFMRDPEGLLLTAAMELPGDESAPSQIIADIGYNATRDDITVSLDMTNVNPHAITGKFDELDFLDPHELMVDGKIHAVLDGALSVRIANIELDAQPGQLVFPGVYDEPFAFEAIGFSAGYDRATGSLAIQRASILKDDVRLDIDAALTVAAGIVKGRVNTVLPALPQEKIAALWPAGARDDSAAEWLIEKITGGSYSDVKASFDLSATRVPDGQGDEDWDVDVANITGALAMAGMTVDYRAPLPAATNVSATGIYENDTLRIKIEQGDIGKLKVGKATVALTELIHGAPGGVEIAVGLSGPVGAVFDYIRHEPIGMSGAQLGFDVAATKGHADLAVDVSFPALRDLPAEKVKVGVKGTLTDTYVPGVVKNMALTGGPFTLGVDNEMVRLDGKGKLDGHDITFKWQQYLESEGKPWSGRVEAKVAADKALRDKMGIALDDWIDGTAPVDVTYTEYGKGRAEAQMRADLSAGRVFVKPFKYEKAPGAPASAQAVALLQGGVLQEIKDLSVQTPDMNMDKARLVFKEEKGESVLRQGTFPRVTLGENDLGLNLEVMPGGAMKLTVTGAVFDARPFLNKERAAGEPPPPPYTGPAIVATINTARMRTHPGRMIEKAKVYLDMAANGDIRRLEVDAQAGKGAVYMRLRPDQSGLMTLRLEADDAGAAMNAFGIYENVRGGKLVILGQAANVNQPKMISGTVVLTDFNAVNAPILARLISAISPLGLAELLASDGIFFARLESKFDWHMRKDGDLFVVKDGRTSGSSLGLTFEGNIDKASQKIDISGHIVPVSIVNSLLSAIPLVGTILSGGSEGGVFAANYTIRGPQKTPVVSVNPLSVLAPGIIRRMLFEE